MSASYPDYFLLVFIGDMGPTNTPSILSELDGTKLDISILTRGNVRKTAGYNNRNWNQEWNGMAKL